MTFESSPGVERSFCPTCGTSLTYRSSTRPDFIGVTTASLDDPDRCARVAEKIAWEALDSGHAHYAPSSRTANPPA